MGSHGLARNTVLNFIGQAVPIAIAVAAMPICVTGYGLDRFALLGLVWTLFGYFAFLDFGFGRGTTRFLAAARGRGDAAAIPGIFWVSMAINLVVGAAAAAILFLCVPWAVRSQFAVPDALKAEAESLFLMMAVAVPAVTLTSALRGALEAAERFDLANAIKVPSNGLLFLVPLLGSLFGWTLEIVVVILVLTRYLTVAASMIAIGGEYPAVFRSVTLRGGPLRELLHYGGWISVSNAVSPLLMYGERFLIAAALPLSALSFYTVPGEATSRLSVIPGSLSAALFPRYSALGRDGTGERYGLLILRPVLFLALLLVPIASAIMFFAPEILLIWLGADFVAASSGSLALLASAFLFNALAYIPFAALQGFGLPSIPTKIHLGLLPLFAVLAWSGVQLFGIEGAAGAKVISHLADALLLNYMCARVLGLNSGVVRAGGLAAAAGSCLALLITAAACVLLGAPLLVRAVAFLVLTAAFLFISWTSALCEEDRQSLQGSLPMLRGRVMNGKV